MKINNFTNGQARNKSACLLNILDKSIKLILGIALILFIVYPLFSVVIRSVYNKTGFLGLKIYREIIASKSHLIWNSLRLSLPVSLLSCILSVLVALYIKFFGGIRRKISISLLLMSMVSPPFISSLSYIELFGRNGLITKRLLGLSIFPYGYTGVLLMEVLFFTSLNTLIIISMLEKIDFSLVRASLDLGASKRTTVIRIVIPLIFPSIISVFLLTFIRSMADFSTPIVIGGRYENIATEIYMQMTAYSDFSKAAVLNVLLMFPAFIVFLLLRVLRSSDERLSSGKAEIKGASEEFKIGGVFAFLIKIFGDLFFIYIILEYLTIFVSSFTKRVKGELVFTDKYFRAVITKDPDTILRSIFYALIVALIGSTIGILISWYIERRKIRFSKVFDFIIMMPYMLPGSCFGIGYILAFNKPPLVLTGTGLIVILNMLFKQLAITVRTASSAFSQISPDIDMAASDLGAPKVLVFKDILVPNLREAFGTGFIHNFASSMTTVGAIIFLISPGKKIAVFTLFDCVNTGKYGEASMIATAIILITVLINILFSKIILKKGDIYVS